jgi:serine/threonine protein kinase
LKPSNIFLAIDRADPAVPEKVKLLDFGIARVEWEEMRITNHGSPLGTAGYMSPEQESGAEVDARSDIFAFGAVLYECLVGEPPPADPGDLWKKGSVAPPGGSKVSGVQETVVPPGWRALIARAVAPSPADRFPDARSFAQALRALRVESLHPINLSL